MSIEFTAVTDHADDQLIIQNFDDLFALYGQLLDPLRAYEDSCERKQNAQSEITRCKEITSGAVFTPFVSAIMFTVYLAIPFLILFYIVVNVIRTPDGAKLLTAFENWSFAGFFAQWFYNLILPMTTSTMGAFFAFIFTFLFNYGIIPCITILLPTLFVFFTFTTIASVIFAKQSIKNCQEIIQKAEVEIKDNKRVLSEPLTFVPPDYRFSMAVEHFYRSYCNGRASTLKEAVNLFDTYLHRSKMEKGLELSVQQQSAILRELEYQSGKINSLERATKNVGSKVERINWKL